jgi:hypothetical protein
MLSDTQVSMLLRAHDAQHGYPTTRNLRDLPRIDCLNGRTG